jgi:hypothetical protein
VFRRQNATEKRPLPHQLAGVSEAMCTFTLLQ